jgi:hypothetical protein
VFIMLLVMAEGTLDRSGSTWVHAARQGCVQAACQVIEQVPGQQQHDATLNPDQRARRSSICCRDQNEATRIDHSVCLWEAAMLPSRLPVIAVIVAVGAAAAACASARQASGDEGTATPLEGSSTRPTGSGALRDLVVRDGDRVRANGQIFRSADGVQLCTHIATVVAGDAVADSTASTAPWTLDCGRFHVINLDGVKVTGQSASVPSSTSGVRLGTAVVVTGRLHGDSITVATLTEQPNESPVSFPSTPCPTPAGGWPTYGRQAGVRNVDPIAGYIRSHRSQFGAFWLSNPSDGRLYPNAEGTRSALEVATIGTTQPIQQAHHQLARLFAGPLCVYTVAHTFHELDTAAAHAKAALGTNLVQATVNEATNHVDVEAKQLTDLAAAKLAPVASLIDLQLHITPL